MPGPSRPSLGLQGSTVRCTSSVSCSWRSSCKYGFSLVLGSRPPPRTLLSSRADVPKHPGPYEHEPVRHAAGHLPQMSMTQAPRHQGADTNQSRDWWQVGVTSTDPPPPKEHPPLCSSLQAQEHQKNTHNRRKYKNKKQVWQFLKKADLEFPCDPAISLPKALKRGSQTSTCRETLTVARAKVAERRKQTRCPSADGTNQCGSRTREYYSAVKRNGAWPHATSQRTSKARCCGRCRTESVSVKCAE